MPKKVNKRQEYIAKAHAVGIQIEGDDDVRTFETLSRFMPEKKALQLIESMNCPDSECCHQLEFVDLKRVSYTTVRPDFSILYFCDGCGYWWDYNVDTGAWQGIKPKAPPKRIFKDAFWV